MEKWTIGELEQATGITIRTPHHYDEIGLVSASERTDAGHHRYTEADLRRLYRVRGLRQLGLSLEEIGVVLQRRTGDLRDLLSAQLARGGRPGEPDRREEGPGPERASSQETSSR